MSERWIIETNEDEGPIYSEPLPHMRAAMMHMHHIWQTMDDVKKAEIRNRGYTNKDGIPYMIARGEEQNGNITGFDIAKLIEDYGETTEAE